MEVNKKYQEEFSNYLNIMNEALKKGDFKAYGVARDMLDESIDDCKERFIISPSSFIVWRYYLNFS